MKSRKGSKSIKMGNQEILNALYEEATIGMMVVNTDGFIVKINPFAANMFGYESNELLGKELEVLLPQSFRKKHVGNRQSYMKHPVPRTMGANLNLFGLHRNGTEFPVRVSLSHVRDGANMLAIAYIHDATEDLRKAKQLEELNQQLEEKVRERTQSLMENETKLEKALEKEKQLNGLKSRFVSMASHEFRTPLSSILSSAGLIGRYTDTEQQDKRDRHIGRIKSSVNNLTSILNDFLSLEKLESGKISSQLIEVNLPDFVTTLLDEINMLPKKDQQIVHQHDGPEFANVDQHLLKNILLNLLSNAVKYSPEGSKIDLLSERTADALTIKVCDYGIGIPLEDQQHMFTRFFRANNVINIQGTGLGLTIVKRYLDLMDGSIGFESVENEGTTFVVRIPQ
ncbi:MAG: ATP-binding protein [Saprospiraceae bacterium]